MAEKFFVIKLIVIGGGKAGQRQFVEYIMNYNDHESINITSRLEGYSLKNIIYKNKKFQLEIWNFTVNERYELLTKICSYDADMIFIFYDISDKKTFERAKHLIDLCTNNNNIFLIGNNYDLNFDDKKFDGMVSDGEVFEFISENNISFAHISTKEKYSNGINELLKNALDKYIKLKNIK